MTQVQITEHCAQRVRCPGCGELMRRELPGEVTQSAFGARFQAAVATLSTRNRVSRRDVVELCEQMFGSRISTGTVDAILARASEALAEPHADLLAALRGSGAVNMDETGWRTAGERRALWGIFDRRHAYLHVAPDRHEDHAKELLADTKAIVTSDRWWAYAHLPLARRQLCWAHLKRDFAAHAEGLSAEKEFGEHGLELCERVFWAWEVFQHTGDRHELKRTVRRLQCEFKPIVGRYASKRARNKYCRGMARNLIKAWPALVDLRPPPRRAAHQQPRRARAPLSSHLPQALPRHPIPRRRTPHRAAPLRAHHLPPPRPLTLRLPHRNAHSARPRRPCPAAHLIFLGEIATVAVPRSPRRPRLWRRSRRRRGRGRAWR